MSQCNRLTHWYAYGSDQTDERYTEDLPLWRAFRVINKVVCSGAGVRDSSSETQAEEADSVADHRPLV